MKSDRPLIALTDISVRIYERSLATSLKRRLLRREPSKSAAHLILDGVTLNVEPGERVGVVGRNGAGKTSFLKVVAGIYPETSGTRRVAGDVVPVITQSLGFSAELSLRRNIRLGLVHHGHHHQWSEAFERKVLDFAELTDRADEPFKVLSSGNQSRLAFAISLFQEPDIFLLDEVFATGDFRFVDKARTAMLDKMARTPITIFVSHDENLVREICSRCLCFAGGRIVADGSPSDVIREYHHLAAS